MQQKTLAPQPLFRGSIYCVCDLRFERMAAGFGEYRAVDRDLRDKNNLSSYNRET
jgi:hypothetical protein